MEPILRIIFWLSASLIIYTLLGYPILLTLLVKIKNFLKSLRPEHALPGGSTPPQGPTSSAGMTHWPKVSLVIPAYNEARVIRQKIENALELDYPQDRLEIVVVSDGSRDETNAMLQAYTAQEIRSVIRRERRGKTSTINEIVRELTGDIVVFSDASALLPPSALKHLIAPFLRDKQVGCVSGTYKLAFRDSSIRGMGERLYWAYETYLKRKESELASTIGAHGALYAIRRELFSPLPENVINDDFVLPMRILAQGYRVVYERRALALEVSRPQGLSEFHRRTRIVAGNFQQIWLLRGLLNPLRGAVFLEFLSHKVLRTLCPWLLLTLFLANICLTAPFYRMIFWGQLSLYLLALLGMILQLLGLLPGRRRVLSASFYFLFGNLSGLIGFFKFLLHRQSVMWTRSDA